MSSFDLRRLRYFVAVAELGSVTRAARELHIAQPALSHQIRLLEDELGAELFARGPQGMRLTELGKTLVEESRSVLREVRALHDRLGNGLRSPEGMVVIGVAQTIGAVLVLPLLELAAKQLPRVRIQIREVMSSDIPDLLRSQSIDFALSYNISSGRGIQSTDIFSEDLYLVGTKTAATPFFGRAHLAELSFADLNNIPLYLSARPNVFREILERAARDRKIKLNIAAEVDSVAIRKHIALSGLGFTILSGTTIREEIRRRRIFAARITDPHIRRKICFVRESGNVLSRAAQEVAVLVAQALAVLAAKNMWPGAVDLPDFSVPINAKGKGLNW